ncbi:MAG: hypothetical protein Q8K98_12320 [Bacteroidota bacterium]|nr:hypothetical protein [Bacteroidota bacterium]
MKKEFSFYEFVGILVPSVTLLFFTNTILQFALRIPLFDFGKLGDSAIFIVIAYGLGHILHSLGNLFETILWKLFNGIPTHWLTKKPRFAQTLFDEHETDKVKSKVFVKFGEVKEKDYGRLVYSWLFNKNLTARIDIFNGNYSLFRGLTICFLILTVLTALFISWQIAVIPVSLAILSLFRMIRFAKYYAREVYRVFLTHEDP